MKLGPMQERVRRSSEHIYVSGLDEISTLPLLLSFGGRTMRTRIAGIVILIGIIGSFCTAESEACIFGRRARRCCPSQACYTNQVSNPTQLRQSDGTASQPVAPQKLPEPLPKLKELPLELKPPAPQ
jgi:hypothetical protein